MTLCALVLAPLAAFASEATAPQPSRIAAVTVYGSGAVVRRASELSGGGRFVLEGLPAELDPESVRVRLQGGEVVTVEVRERLRRASSDPRLGELQGRIDGLRRELRVLEDERATSKDLEQLLASLAQYQRDEARGELAQGRAGVEGWGTGLVFLAERLGDTRKALRELGWKVEAKQAEIRALERELGLFQGRGDVPVKDVHLDVVARAAGPLALELDYFVHGAGWSPSYDLRAAKDLARVELVYRAQVWQQTGEDWREVELALSTARPQLGAQGPEPVLSWLDLRDPRRVAPQARVAMEFRAGIETADESRDDAALGKLGAPVRTTATIEAQGLSVRFVLPRKESVESRDQPSNVLVGRAELAFQAERHCVPALDTTVWVRGEAKNTSEWTLLPGRAAVFLGDDYLGSSQLSTVQPGQALTLHLGADPGVTVERKLVTDETKQPGFLSSRVSVVERWRVRLENHGTLGTAADGSVSVIVRESVPRTKDDRISVQVTRSEPAESADPRWKEEREELGIHTWVLRVPRGGATDLLLETTIQHPKDLELVRRSEPMPRK